MWALDEAAARNADLDVVHAWSIPILAAAPVIAPYHVDAATLDTAAKGLLTHEIGVGFGRTTRRPPRIEEMAVQDSAAHALIEISHGADLLVMGTRGHGGFAELLLGSVGIHCLRHAPCPVAVIREGAPDGPIVVGVDGSNHGDVALRWAFGEAARLGAPLQAVASWFWSERLFHRIDVGYDDERAHSLVEERVVRARAWVPAAADVDVTVDVVDEPPGPALVAASAAARMLVVGTRGLGGFRGMVLGSVSDHCAHNARCPVVVVRTPVSNN